MKELIIRILKFMGEIIKNNFGYKLISLILAVLCWFIVMNIINPTEEKVYSVDITYLNEDKLTENNLVIMNKDEIKRKAEIRVKATRSDLDALDKKENRQKIIATVELNQIVLVNSENINDKISVSVYPNLMQDKSSYQILGCSPANIEIDIDKIVTVTKNVIVNPKGRVAEGYLATEPICDPSAVEISGPSRIVKNVDHVYADFDYGNASSDIEKKVVPKVYNSKNEIVEGISINISDINVTSNVSHRGKVNIAEPVISGEPAEGYIISKISYNPKQIDVIGDETPIKNIKEIKMNEFDVSGSTGTRTFMYDISNYLSNFGVQPQNTDDTLIAVTVEIEKRVHKTIDFKDKSVDLEGKNSQLYEYTITQADPLIISGNNDSIELIDSENLKAECNVSGVGEGTHLIKGKVDFSSDSKIDIEQEPTFNITVALKNENRENVDEESTETTSAAESETNTSAEQDTTKKNDE